MLLNCVSEFHNKANISPECSSTVCLSFTTRPIFHQNAPQLCVWVSQQGQYFTRMLLNCVSELHNKANISPDLMLLNFFLSFTTRPIFHQNAPQLCVWASQQGQYFTRMLLNCVSEFHNKATISPECYSTVCLSFTTRPIFHQNAPQLCVWASQQGQYFTSNAPQLCVWVSQRGQYFTRMLLNCVSEFHNKANISPECSSTVCLSFTTRPIFHRNVLQLCVWVSQQGQYFTRMLLNCVSEFYNKANISPECSSTVCLSFTTRPIFHQNAPQLCVWASQQGQYFARMLLNRVSEFHNKANISPACSLTVCLSFTRPIFHQNAPQLCVWVSQQGQYFTRMLLNCVSEFHNKATISPECYSTVCLSFTTRPIFHQNAPQLCVWASQQGQYFTSNAPQLCVWVSQRGQYFTRMLLNCVSEFHNKANISPECSSTVCLSFTTRPIFHRNVLQLCVWVSQQGQYFTRMLLNCVSEFYNKANISPECSSTVCLSFTTRPIFHQNAPQLCVWASQQGQYFARMLLNRVSEFHNKANISPACSLTVCLSFTRPIFHQNAPQLCVWVSQQGQYFTRMLLNCVSEFHNKANISPECSSTVCLSFTTRPIFHQNAPQLCVWASQQGQYFTRMLLNCVSEFHNKANISPECSSTVCLSFTTRPIFHQNAPQLCVWASQQGQYFTRMLLNCVSELHNKANISPECSSTVCLSFTTRPIFHQNAPQLCVWVSQQGQYFTRMLLNYVSELHNKANISPECSSTVCLSFTTRPIFLQNAPQLCVWVSQQGQYFTRMLLNCVSEFHNKANISPECSSTVCLSFTTRPIFHQNAPQLCVWVSQQGQYFTRMLLNCVSELHNKANISPECSSTVCLSFTTRPIFHQNAPQLCVWASQQGQYFTRMLLNCVSELHNKANISPECSSTVCLSFTTRPIFHQNAPQLCVWASQQGQYFTRMLVNCVSEFHNKANISPECSSTVCLSFTTRPIFHQNAPQLCVWVSQQGQYFTRMLLNCVSELHNKANISPECSSTVCLSFTTRPIFHQNVPQLCVWASQQGQYFTRSNAPQLFS